MLLKAVLNAIDIDRLHQHSHMYGFCIIVGDKQHQESTNGHESMSRPERMQLLEPCELAFFANGCAVCAVLVCAQPTAVVSGIVGTNMPRWVQAS